MTGRVADAAVGRTNSMNPSSTAGPVDPPNWQPRVRWTVLLALAAGCMVLLGFGRLWTWGLFDMFAFEPRFADTVAILAAGEARHAGADVYGPNSFDPLHRPHVYGPAWLLTGAAGLTVRDAVWIGSTLAGLFLVSAACTLAPRRLSEAVMALLLLCSPPVLLGVSRGNNDLVVFLLLSGAAWLLARRVESAAMAGRFLVGFVATLKLYPFAALPMLFLRDYVAKPPSIDRADAGVVARVRAGRGYAVIWFAAVVVLSFGVLWFWRDDYRQALHLAPNPVTLMAYGLPVTLLTWQAVPAVHPALVVGGAIGLLLVFFAAGRRMGRLWTAVPAGGFSSFAYLAGALAWIFCFCAIRNYPYRLILLLLPARLWLAQSGTSKDQGIARNQLLLWAFVAWLDVPKRLLVAAARPETSPAAPAWQGLMTVVGFEQGVLLGLTVCLAIGVLGCFVRVLLGSRAAAGDLRPA